MLEKLKELQQKANEIIKTPATFEGKSSELDFSNLSAEEKELLVASANAMRSVIDQIKE